ncbi:TPA: hypothetical protein ACN33U_004698, partial [Vibrio parahaemolyticus]
KPKNSGQKSQFSSPGFGFEVSDFSGFNSRFLRLVAQFRHAVYRWFSSLALIIPGQLERNFSLKLSSVCLPF